MPFFSPDGQWVGFFAAGRLKKISVERGSAVTIARAPNARGGSWGRDDIIVFSDTGLHRVSADGGVPEQLTKPDFDETGYNHVWPHHMPGARDVLFTVWDMDDVHNVVVLNLETGEWRKIDLGAVYLRQYLPTGHLLFAAPSRGGGLFAAPFDRERLSVTGATVSVIDDVRFLLSWSAWPYVTVSQSGTIVYPRESSEPAELAWMDRDGSFSPIHQREGSVAAPRLSPDGESVLFHDDQGNVWVLDIDRGTVAVVASKSVLQGNSTAAIWNPDGRRITFSSNRFRDWDLYETALSERGEPESLLVRPYDQSAESWSPDGRLLAFSEVHPVTGPDLWLLPIGEEPIPILVTEFNETSVVFSPDGRLLAYVSDESDQHQVYIRSYPEGETFLVSVDGGEEPVWSRDGSELFFRHGSALLAVTVTSEPEFRASAPRVLHRTPFDRNGFGEAAYYDVSPDGERFVVVADRSTTELEVVFNWFQELERLVPTDP